MTKTISNDLNHSCTFCGFEYNKPVPKMVEKARSSMSFVAVNAIIWKHYELAQNGLLFINTKCKECMMDRETLTTYLTLAMYGIALDKNQAKEIEG